MKIIDQALERIKRGREGLNVGLPMGFDRLVQYLPNIQQATYYLLGGAAKSGKTTLACDMFVYNPYDYTVANPNTIELDIDYYSFEIEKVNLLLKGVTRRLYLKYGFRADVNEILSKGKAHCSDELYGAVIESRDYFSTMEDVLHIHDTPLNPTGINKYLYGKAEKHGKVIRKPIEIKEDDGTTRTIEVFDRYIPNNPNRYHIVIIDHLGLMHPESGFALKQNMDKMSQYLVALRNNYGIIPVVVQQLSFDSQSNERFMSKRLTPTVADFGDSRYTIRDCNVAMALYSPATFGMTNFDGYNVSMLGDKFRNLEILVNREGEPNINIGLLFEGQVGMFKELPKAKDLKTNEDYQRLLI